MYFYYVGSLDVSIFLDIFWKDFYLTWNSSLTDDIFDLYIPSNDVWTPDITLYNALGDFKLMMSTTEVYVTNDGSMWWGRPGQIRNNFCSRNIYTIFYF